MPASAVGSAVLSVVAHGQVADRPQWVVGDRWNFQQISGLPATERDWSRVVEQELPDGRLQVKAGKSTLIARLEDCPEVQWIAKYATREQASLSVPFISSESVLTRYAVTN